MEHGVKSRGGRERGGIKNWFIVSLGSKLCGIYLFV